MTIWGTPSGFVLITTACHTRFYYHFIIKKNILIYHFISYISRCSFIFKSVMCRCTLITKELFDPFITHQNIIWIIPDHLQNHPNHIFFLSNQKIHCKCAVSISTKNQSRCMLLAVHFFVSHKFINIRFLCHLFSLACIDFLL